MDGDSGMNSVTFTVPGEPKGKGRPRVGMRGKKPIMYTPPETVEYENKIAAAASAANPSGGLFAGPVRLEIRIFHPIRDSWPKKKQEAARAGQMVPTMKVDIDNALKAVCDALNGVLWLDDVQVVNVGMSKRFSDTPRLEITVTELPLFGV